MNWWKLRRPWLLLMSKPGAASKPTRLLQGGPLLIQVVTDLTAVIRFTSYGLVKESSEAAIYPDSNVCRLPALKLLQVLPF